MRIEHEGYVPLHNIDIDITPPSGCYKVWVDGAYDVGRNRKGAAGVIFDARDDYHPLFALGFDLRSLNLNGSELAELCAAVLTLQAVQDRRVVELTTDCQSLKGTLNRQKHLSRQAVDPCPSLAALAAMNERTQKIARRTKRKQKNVSPKRTKPQSSLLRTLLYHRFKGSIIKQSELGCDPKIRHVARNFENIPLADEFAAAAARFKATEAAAYLPKDMNGTPFILYSLDKNAFPIRTHVFAPENMDALEAS
ncbi:MAG: hypothetical protein ACLFP8_02195 [Alphaproteobacteria bacterium]